MLENLKPEIREELQNFIKNNPKELNNWHYSEDVDDYAKYDLANPSICLLNILLIIRHKIPAKIIKGRNVWRINIDNNDWADVSADKLETLTKGNIKKFFQAYFYNIYGDDWAGFDYQKEFNFLEDAELMGKLANAVEVL